MEDMYKFDESDPIGKMVFLNESNGYELYEHIDDMYDFEGVDYYVVEKYFPEFEIDTTKQYIILKDGEQIYD